jgi:hypothetical protein
MTPPHTLMVRAMSPKTLLRYAATSKSAWNATNIERRRIDALKRVVRRRQARKRHFDAFGPLRRLKLPLFENKATAIRRLSMSPGTIRDVKRRRAIREARRAYGTYLQNGNWNHFVRVHIKSGGKPNISRKEAFRMYN